MIYTEKQFSGCVFNPLVKGKMNEKYPRLNEILNAECTDANTDKILRFIICVYDPKSPVFINERDLNFRKGTAASLVGFDMNDEELLESIYTCTHDYFVDLVIRFLIRFIKSKEYAAIVIVENCFWESAKKLMEPITGKNSKEELEAVQKKSAIKDELDKDILRLDKYMKSFFGDDDDLESMAKTRMTPETVGRLTKPTAG